jgi:arabinogalactan endo-1,4-beta-galactosidase
MNRRQFLKLSAAASLALTGCPGVNRLLAAEPSTLPSPRTDPYILGADISWLLEDEAQGAVYYDRGVQKDIFAILKSYQFNFIRVRIFVNPHAPRGYSARRNEAFCDLDHTKKMANRIKAAGLGFLLSIHYGDTWTSPASQAKPAAWADLPYAKLVQTVHDWTAGVVKELGANGTPPQMVSVGNETSGGVLFPDGRASNPDHFAELINAGCTAVRGFDPKIPIALHHHLGRDNAAVRPWVDNFVQHKTEFDIIGMSCYSQAHAGDWQNNFDDLAVRYPQLSFVAMECSYQKRYLNDLIFNAPNQKGLGSFIWEPTRWREAIFDHGGRNAGADMNNRPHLPASTLPPLDAPDQPVYHPATPPPGEQNPAVPTAPPIGARNTTMPTTGPTSRRAFVRNGGRYDTNSYILAYPEMAKAYGLVDH